MRALSARAEAVASVPWPHAWPLIREVTAERPPRRRKRDGLDCCVRAKELGLESARAMELCVITLTPTLVSFLFLYLHLRAFPPPHPPDLFSSARDLLLSFTQRNKKNQTNNHKKSLCLSLISLIHCSHSCQRRRSSRLRPRASLSASPCSGTRSRRPRCGTGTTPSGAGPRPPRARRRSR